LGTGRPILALAHPDSDVAWALRHGGAPHRVAPLLDGGAIRQALLALDEDVRAGRLAAAVPAGQSPFTRRQMVRQVAAILDSCCHDVVFGFSLPRLRPGAHINTQTPRAAYGKRR
jgi:hypothetical protein